MTLIDPSISRTAAATSSRSEMPCSRPAEAAEQQIPNDQRRGGHQAADERHVTTIHRVLDRIRDDQDHDEVGRAHLPELALSGEAQQSKYGDVHDHRPYDDLPERDAQIKHVRMLARPLIRTSGWV
jgi:hypothetical protein